MSSALILFDGLKRLSKFMSYIVPVIGMFFIVACLIVIFNFSCNFFNASKQVIYGEVGVSLIFVGGLGFAFTSEMSTGVSLVLLEADIVQGWPE